MSELRAVPRPTTAASDRIDRFRHDGLTFDVVDGGPIDATPVVLLHGWPGGVQTWARMAPLLHQSGLRTLALQQRGYAPEARPRSASRYDMASLGGDVIALMDAAGLARAHVVGHDWGGAVAWHLAANAADRLDSVTVLSTPHPAAMASSLWSSTQLLRSSYVAAFQLPIVPERMLTVAGGVVLRRLLEGSGLDRAQAAAYAEQLSTPDAVGGSLAWYRALARAGMRRPGPSLVPTLYVWSSGDGALGRRAAELTANHVDAAYRFVELHGVPHWIPEVATEEAADLVVGQVRRTSST